jgi:hypothetical protein
MHRFCAVIPVILLAETIYPTLKRFTTRMSGQEITGDSLQCLAGFYAFQPSIPLAAVFCALFGVTTVIHAVQMSVARTWYMSALVLGGFCAFF